MPAKGAFIGHPVIDQKDVNTERYFAQHRPLARPSAPAALLIGAAVVALGSAFIPLTWAYGAGYAVCHQLAERSFFVIGQKLPLCGRDTGIYLGALLTLVVLGLWKGRAASLPPWRVLALLVLFVVMMAVDGVNSYLVFFGVPQLYPSHNLLRLVTGALFGVSGAVLLFAFLNMVLWKEAPAKPALRGLRDLGSLLAVPALLVVVVYLSPDFLLRPLTFLSGSAVVFFFALFNGLVALVALRIENAVSRWSELALPFAIGLGMGLAEILAMGRIRAAVTLVLALPF